MSYEDLLSDEDVTMYRDVVPYFNTVVKRELGLYIYLGTPVFEAKKKLIKTLDTISRRYSNKDSKSNIRGFLDSCLKYFRV